jgi:hypothetical protein
MYFDVFGTGEQKGAQVVVFQNCNQGVIHLVA